jgi:hypothetical protein
MRIPEVSDRLRNISGGFKEVSKWRKGRNDKFVETKEVEAVHDRVMFHVEMKRSVLLINPARINWKSDETAARVASSPPNTPFHMGPLAEPKKGPQRFPEIRLIQRERAIAKA